MTIAIESVTTSLLGMALDAASLRQQAIATNIANVDTAGYVPRQVSFEAQLEQARRSLDADGAIDPFSLGTIRPRIEAAPDGLASPVRLDVEVAKMAQNTVQYQTLVKAINRHFAILNTAASDGKR
jgi:flagellar basal-body rod protein FlgB